MKEVAAEDLESDIRIRLFERLRNSLYQCGRDTLISVKVEYPWVLESDIPETPILVLRPLIEHTLRN